MCIWAVSIACTELDAISSVSLDYITLHFQLMKNYVVKLPFWVLVSSNPVTSTLSFLVYEHFFSVTNYTFTYF